MEVKVGFALKLLKFPSSPQLLAVNIGDSDAEICFSSSFLPDQFFK